VKCSLCARSCQALPVWGELTNTTLRKQRWGTFFTSNLKAIVGITSHYCVILKMVILHDAIKTIQNGAFVFFEKVQKPISLKKNGLKKQVFFFKTSFSQL